jgi:hypothetical protein
MATKKKKPTKKTVPYRSFVRADGPKPFMNFRFTQQTVYWILIGMLILALGAWTMYLTVRVQNLYDAADNNSRNNDSYMAPKH